MRHLGAMVILPILLLSTLQFASVNLLNPTKLVTVRHGVDWKLFEPEGEEAARFALRSGENVDDDGDDDEMGGEEWPDSTTSGLPSIVNRDTVIKLNKACRKYEKRAVITGNGGPNATNAFALIVECCPFVSAKDPKADVGANKEKRATVCGRIVGSPSADLYASRSNNYTGLEVSVVLNIDVVEPEEHRLKREHSLKKLKDFHSRLPRHDSVLDFTAALENASSYPIFNLPLITEGQLVDLFELVRTDRKTVQPWRPCWEQELGVANFKACFLLQASINFDNEHSYTGEKIVGVENGHAVDGSDTNLFPMRAVGFCPTLFLNFTLNFPKPLPIMIQWSPICPGFNVTGMFPIEGEAA